MAVDRWLLLLGLLCVAELCVGVIGQDCVVDKELDDAKIVSIKPPGGKRIDSFTDVYNATGCNRKCCLLQSEGCNVAVFLLIANAHQGDQYLCESFKCELDESCTTLSVSVNHNARYLGGVMEAKVVYLQKKTVQNTDNQDDTRGADDIQDDNDNDINTRSTAFPDWSTDKTLIAAYKDFSDNELGNSKDKSADQPVQSLPFQTDNTNGNGESENHDAKGNPQDQNTNLDTSLGGDDKSNFQASSLDTNANAHSENYDTKANPQAGPQALNTFLDAVDNAASQRKDFQSPFQNDTLWEEKNIHPTTENVPEDEEKNNPIDEDLDDGVDWLLHNRMGGMVHNPASMKPNEHKEKPSYTDGDDGTVYQPGAGEDRGPEIIITIDNGQKQERRLIIAIVIVCVMILMLTAFAVKQIKVLRGRVKYSRIRDDDKSTSVTAMQPLMID